MYMRDGPANPKNMDDAGRLEEVASIFARGILRLRDRVIPHVSAEQSPPEFSPTSLDRSAASRPGLPAG